MNQHSLFAALCLAVGTMIGTGCSTTGACARAGQPVGLTAAKRVTVAGGQVGRTAVVGATAGAGLATTAGSSAAHTAWTLVCFPVNMVRHPLATPFRTVADVTKTSVKLTKKTVATVGTVVVESGAGKIATQRALARGVAVATPHGAALAAGAEVGAPLAGSLLAGAVSRR